ncbi:DUF499 domain-containing protein [Dehalogenimonas sp. 4OHTPN]|uniref:DUF499 domain-containing protein n=1 Tax=Dehalogenimonas sp. 4OHTPN TaxID=3166643 RepID=A0AAU8GAS0_9CHLR
MKTVFENCKPREDVLKGELKEERFAAHLRDVIDAKADPIYREPGVFFEYTYPTEGLRQLLREALGRLAGTKTASAPIIRLETSFGGGKTHNLIALYHTARVGNAGADMVSRFVDTSIVPAEPIDLIAGIVGSDLDPTNGLDHGDCVTYTVWGEIAYQLGGLAGYRLMQKSDETKVAPGVQVFEKLVGDRPALILLDEFAAFLRKAEGVPVGESNLAEQSSAFLLTLLSFAAKMQRVVVVITLADVKDAFGAETERVQAVMAEAGKVTARQERIITPTSETEIAPIVTHRLFQNVDSSEGAVTARAYSDYIREQLDRRVELPESSGRAEYSEEIQKNYPFSPELIVTLNRKTSTIPDFQRTRGALRLLALVVRKLWQNRPVDAWLIHPHHIDLSDDDVLNELTSRLKRPQYRQVAEADIVSLEKGSLAHAALVDRPFIDAGRPDYARRFGTTVFLHSIVQGVASGVDHQGALLAVLEPGDDPGNLQKAIESLLDSAWFLDYDGRRYRFKTEPSLNKLIADEAENAGRLKPKEELNHRIKNVWRKGIFQPIYFPSEAAEVDDDSGIPKLVVIHYDAAKTTALESAPPELVIKIAEHAGTQEGFRVFRNNVLFLVADTDQIERMIEVARRHFAIARIVNDADRMREFAEEQRKKLKGMLEETELQYRIAITRAYRYMYYPSADALDKNGRLAKETLPAQDQGNVDQDQSQVLLRVLRQLDKALTADDKPLNAAYLKSKAWPAGKEYVSTEEIRRAFGQRLGLKILIDINQLKASIRDGCKKTGVWVYQAPGEQEVYGLPSPVPSIVFDESAILYTPEGAKAIGLPVKGEQKPICPICACPVDACICAGEVREPEKETKVITFEGAPGQAFQAVLDQARDQKVQRLYRLGIKVEGTGPDAANDSRLIGLAIPQIGKGNFKIEQVMNCEFGAETFSLSFKGSWEKYKQVKTLTDAFGKLADKVHARTRLEIEFDSGLDLDNPQLEVIRDIFSTLGFGKIVVSAEKMNKETG